jgi:hypothetical protein
MFSLGGMLSEKKFTGGVSDRPDISANGASFSKHDAE